jgi:hypothetical protein
MPMLELYAYSPSSESEEMRALTDLSISATPKVLRLIGTFLSQIANEIESGRLRNSHIHIESRISGWREISNGIDIQVINTNYEGPAICATVEPE